MLRGLYTDWTAPVVAGFRNDRRHNVIRRHDYADLVLILSVLKWKQHNGVAVLYTDSEGESYYRQRDMLRIWDEVDTRVLNGIDQNKYAPEIFWSYGKLLTTKTEERNSIQIDTDLVCWRNIEKEVCASDVFVLHPEPLADKRFSAFYESIRPVARKEYRYKDEWDWTSTPLNTALLYVKAQEFMDYWFYEMERFARYNDDPRGKIRSRNMIFADQQLLALCLREKGLEASYLIKNINDPDANDCITHLWLYKGLLEHDEVARANLSRKAAIRISTEFPEFVVPSWMRSYLGSGRDVP